MKRKKYDIKRGSATWRLGMREAYKNAGMEDMIPEKFKLQAKSKAIKKMKEEC